MTDTGLVKYDEMVHAIAVCHSTDEVKDIRDKALALEKYAQVAMNTDAERQAAEIRVRAERRAGELLAGMEKAKPTGSNQHKQRSHDVTDAPTLADLGISKNQSSKWQRLAQVDSATFEDAVSGPDKPSTSGVLRKANGGSKAMDDDALWLWGRLREFSKRGIVGREPDELFGEMTEAMQDELRDIIRDISDFITDLEKEICRI